MSEGPGSTLAERLDYLFRKITKPDGSEYSYEAVADAIRAEGVQVSHTYIWKLRTGRNDNPTLKHLKGLASYFGVPTGYFLDEQTAADVAAQVGLLSALRDVRVRNMAMRAVGLSPQTMHAVAEIIEAARRVERVPDPPPQPESRQLS